MLKSFKFLTPGKRLGIKKPFRPIRLELRQPCFRDVTDCAPKILCEQLSNISQIDCHTTHIHTEIEPFTSCIITLAQYICPCTTWQIHFISRIEMYDQGNRSRGKDDA